MCSVLRLLFVRRGCKSPATQERVEELINELLDLHGRRDSRRVPVPDSNLGFESEHTGGDQDEDLVSFGRCKLSFPEGVSPGPGGTPLLSPRGTQLFVEYECEVEVELL